MTRFFFLGLLNAHWCRTGLNANSKRGFTQVQMKNVRLDTPANIKLNAQNVYQQVSVTQQMPMNNATGICGQSQNVLGT